MTNLTRINLTLSQSLTQSLEKILVLFNQLQALQSQTNANKPATENRKPTRRIGTAIQISTAGLMEGPTVFTILYQHASNPRKETR